MVFKADWAAVLITNTACWLYYRRLNKHTETRTTEWVITCSQSSKFNFSQTSQHPPQEETLVRTVTKTVSLCVVDVVFTSLTSSVKYTGAVKVQALCFICLSLSLTCHVSPQECKLTSRSLILISKEQTADSWTRCCCLAPGHCCCSTV